MPRATSTNRTRVAAVAGVILTTWWASGVPAAYIPTMGGILHHAQISGDWIAWGENVQGMRAAIYARNLVSGETRAITADDPATPDVNEAAGNIWTWAWYHPQIGISGSTVVFPKRRDGSTVIDIRAHNLDTGVETTVSPLWITDNGFPAIDGNWVAWQYGSSSAYIATTSGGSLRSLGGDGMPMPDVDGDIVAWKIGNTVGSRIQYRNMVTRATGTLFQADEYEDLRSQVIDGNIVAWSMRDEDEVLGTVVRIVAYDMSTGQLTTIKTHTGSPVHRSMVSVSNGIVVWEDWRNSTEQKDIYGYDLSTGREFAIATGPADQRGPCIDGDMVVWSEGTTGGQIGWVRLSDLLDPTLLADVNLDGTANALDIDAFVQRVTSGTYQAEADCNQDGSVNALDIEKFVYYITAATAHVVPEPATWGLLTVAVAMGVMRARWSGC